jgi:hypothetical protein
VPLVLEEDGLGVVAFGTEGDAAVQAITVAIGEPDEDSGWIASFSGFGSCPGERVRGLRWGTLWALLTDGETEWRTDGVPHFFAYLNSVFYDNSRSLGLLTEQSIGLGDSVEALEDRYGDRVEIAFDELIATFVFDIEAAEPGRLRGALTGDRSDDLITSIDGGRGCEG